MKRIVLLPAYMPDGKLADVARGMFDAGFDVVIVNDGSPEEYSGVFQTASSVRGCSAMRTTGARVKH